MSKRPHGLPQPHSTLSDSAAQLYEQKVLKAFREFEASQRGAQVKKKVVPIAQQSG